jgi:hypothetical protein
MPGDLQQIGDKHRVNMARSELAHLERRQGHTKQALPLYHETILAWQDLGHRAAVAHQLECIAFIVEAEGNAQRAARLLGAAEALREKTGSSMAQLEHAEYEAALDSIHARIDESSFAEAWAEGRAMTMEEAIADALEPVNNLSPSS